MSLIDISYFVGPLNISNTNKQEIQERLNYFIEKNERRFLDDLLGYEFAKNFIEGLQASLPQQKWIDLLQGKEYTNVKGKLAKWQGIIPGGDVNLNVANSNSFPIVVGRGQAFDPVPNSQTTIIPPQFVGKTFPFIQRLTGELLLGTEYTVNANVLTLLNWPFSNNDVYFYGLPSINVSIPSGVTKRSMIANYVYTEWLRDQYTQTSGIGEVVTKAENATVVTPTNKIIAAWNELFDWVCDLISFLDANTSVYTEWDQSEKNIVLRKFWRINQFGI